MSNEHVTVQSRLNHKIKHTAGMEIGKPYRVTKASDDGTFELGDHISLCADGTINCTEAGGWIERCDVAEATKGMAVKLDKDWIEARKRRLIKELDTLNN